MAKDGDLKARLRASAPVHGDETPEYKKFNAAYRVAFPLAFVVLAYATFFIFGGRVAVQWLWGSPNFRFCSHELSF